MMQKTVYADRIVDLNTNTVHTVSDLVTGRSNVLKYQGMYPVVFDPVNGKEGYFTDEGVYISVQSGSTYYPLPDIVQYFRTFDPVVGTYGTIPTWTANGDFRVSITCVIPSADGIYRTLSGTSTGDIFGVNTSGGVATSLAIKVGGIWYSYNSATIQTENLTTIVFERIGTTLNFYENETVFHSRSISQSTVNVDSIAINSDLSTFPFNGIISRVKLTDYAGVDNRQYTNFTRSDGVIPNDLDPTGVTNGTLYNAADGSAERFVLTDGGASWVNAFWPNLIRYSEAETNTNNWQAIVATVSYADVYYADIYRGVTITSNGALWHRLNSPSADLTVGGNYTISALIKAGSSGSANLRIRATTSGKETFVGGSLSGVFSITSEVAGSVSSFGKEDLEGGYYLLYFTFNPNASDSYAIGVSPNSTTIGEDVVLLGVQIEEGVISSYPFKLTEDTAGKRIPIAGA